MNYADVIATLAFIIALVDLVLIIWDRWPRLKVGIHTEVHWDEDADLGPVPIANRLWIGIANHSAKRIWMTRILVECGRYWRFPFRRWQTALPDLQRWEAEGKAPTARFWIDPWGNTILSADADELEYEVKHAKRPGWIWYNVAVQDGLGNWYRSNLIRCKVEMRQAS